jgi:uncharacterized membrane protein YbjE (DUF340 family)
MDSSFFWGHLYISSKTVLFGFLVLCVGLQLKNNGKNKSKLFLKKNKSYNYFGDKTLCPLSK